MFVVVVSVETTGETAGTLTAGVASIPVLAPTVVVTGTLTASVDAATVVSTDALAVGVVTAELVAAGVVLVGVATAGLTETASADVTESGLAPPPPPPHAAREELIIIDRTRPVLVLNESGILISSVFSIQYSGVMVAASGSSL